MRPRDRARRPAPACCPPSTAARREGSASMVMGTTKAATRMLTKPPSALAAMNAQPGGCARNTPQLTRKARVQPTNTVNQRTCPASTVEAAPAGDLCRERNPHRIAGDIGAQSRLVGERLEIDADRRRRAEIDQRREQGIPAAPRRARRWPSRPASGGRIAWAGNRPRGCRRRWPGRALRSRHRRRNPAGTHCANSSAATVWPAQSAVK